MVFFFQKFLFSKQIFRKFLFEKFFDEKLLNIVRHFVIFAFLRANAQTGWRSGECWGRASLLAILVFFKNVRNLIFFEKF